MPITIRLIESAIGPIKVNLYRVDGQCPTRKVMQVEIQDQHWADRDAEKCFVNRIPVQFNYWLQAELYADLTNSGSWKYAGSPTVTRLDYGPTGVSHHNDGTDSQRSKILAICYETLATLFADPNFVFEVVFTDQNSDVDKQKQEVEKAEQALREAKTLLHTLEVTATEMSARLDPPLVTSEAEFERLQHQHRYTFGLLPPTPEEDE